MAEQYVQVPVSLIDTVTLRRTEAQVHGSSARTRESVQRIVAFGDTPPVGVASLVVHADRAALALREAADEIDRLRALLSQPTPTVVCICGSTRFRDEMTDANRRLTLGGSIVVAPGVFGHSGDAMTDDQKVALDALHFRKIDLATSIYVVNPGGYIGESTAREIAYAERTGKPIAYLIDPSMIRDVTPPKDAA